MWLSKQIAVSGSSQDDFKVVATRREIGGRPLNRIGWSVVFHHKIYTRVLAAKRST